MESEAERWLLQARADFKSSKALIDSHNYYASVTFSQQCAEKALKAVYIFIHQKFPPKMHDLVELGRLVMTPKSIQPKAEVLAGTYLSSRYPGAGPEIPVRYYDRQKANDHFKRAKVILTWAEKKIQS